MLHDCNESVQYLYIAQEITIRMMKKQLSGLPDQEEFFETTGPSVNEYYGEQPEEVPYCNRSNLRDIIIIICIFSSVVYDLDKVRLILSFFLLTFGCFFHYVTKGVLIRNVILCKEGTYNVVRHPYYMANYLIDSSFCLLSGNIYLFFAYPFLFYWSYGPTIRQEESMLAEIHGEDFLKYSLECHSSFRMLIQYGI